MGGSKGCGGLHCSVNSTCAAWEAARGAGGGIKVQGNMKWEQQVEIVVPTR